MWLTFGWYELLEKLLIYYFLHHPIPMDITPKEMQEEAEISAATNADDGIDLDIDHLCSANATKSYVPAKTHVLIDWEHDG